jgi:hypothetical protein
VKPALGDHGSWSEQAEKQRGGVVRFPAEHEQDDE